MTQLSQLPYWLPMVGLLHWSTIRAGVCAWLWSSKTASLFLTRVWLIMPYLLYFFRPSFTFAKCTIVSMLSYRRSTEIVSNNFFHLSSEILEDHHNIVTPIQLLILLLFNFSCARVFLIALVLNWSLLWRWIFPRLYRKFS